MISKGFGSGPNVTSSYRICSFVSIFQVLLVWIWILSSLKTFIYQKSSSHTLILFHFSAVSGELSAAPSLYFAHTGIDVII